MKINSPDKLETRGAVEVKFTLVDQGEIEQVDGEVVEEALACISVNGVELATFMCSPTSLDDLAVGFLFNENLISSFDEIATLHVSDRDCVEVWVNHEIQTPEKKIVTAGCGGGVTFDDLSQTHEALHSSLTIAPERLTVLMRGLQMGAAVYLRSRGIHTAALADQENILLQVEDLGRHNCIDKLAGAALRSGLDFKDKILLSSGRISSEMLNKARRMGIPIICSRTSPTSLSVALAKAWNITIVAYLRGRRMRVYTHEERVVGKTANRSSNAANNTDN